PWMGQSLPAAEIRRRLAGKNLSPAPELKALKRKALEVPATVSWVVERPTVAADGVALARPNALYWYDGAQARPAWAHTFPLAPTKDLWAPVLPGPFQPAVGAGNIYTRWGIQPNTGPNRGYLLANVTAFDLRTGIQVWSTAANPGWQDLCPMN